MKEGKNGGPLHIFCDFDGTITSRDSIVALTAEFGTGIEYRNHLVEQVRQGRLSNFECIRLELATVRASWDEARRFIETHIFMDPEFPGFVDWCRQREYPLSVVSSGIEQVVEHFVGALGIPYYAHPVEIDRKGWVYRKRAEHEKDRILGGVPDGTPVVFVGDGTSDIEAIPHADILFAKSYLAEHCSKQGIAFQPFETFADVQQHLETTLT